MRLDLTGRRFGRLLVSPVCRVEKNKRLWLCACDCGSEKEILSNSLMTGRTVSCGCMARALSSARSRTHGQTKSAEYRIWAGMIQRCTHPDGYHEKYYLDRGISVCDRWKRFENFFEDMGRRPGRGYSIERINNDGNYEPGNCRWATKIEQARNRRNNHYLTINGETLTLAEWRTRTNLSRSRMDYCLKTGRSIKDLVLRNLT